MAKPDFIHVLVSGPPASGKSTLLQALTNALPRQFTSHVVLWHGGSTVYRFSPRGRGLPKAYAIGTKRSIRVDIGIDAAGMQLVFIRRDHVGAKPYETRLHLPRDMAGWSWSKSAARAVLEVIAEVNHGE